MRVLLGRAASVLCYNMDKTLQAVLTGRADSGILQELESRLQRRGSSIR